jgi:AAA15 family ATPase/GTPase
MLLQFNFKNYKSFRDDTTLDLTATKITDYNYHVVSVAKEKILPVATLYGANASGKSNVLEAFRYMTSYVMKSLNFGDENGKNRKSVFPQPTPFLFDTNSNSDVSTFEVYFITSEEDGARSYNYGFTVNKSGIVEEWLNYKTKSSRNGYKKIFYRNRKKLDLEGIAHVSQKNIEIALEKETLIVSLGSKFKISILKLIRDWFIVNSNADFGRPVENFVLSKLLPPDFDKNKDTQQNVVRYFSAFDPSIVGFNVETFESGDDRKNQRININAKHKIIGSDKLVTIPLELESSGTLKMFSLFPFLQDILETGGALFVDELNSQLHPLLLRTFIMTFLNPETNPKHAQLIFTSHSSWVLSSEILRRDEVWFTEKSDNGVSTLYSLADFVNEDGTKIRKDENYEKNYLLGKYGAIPTMKFLDVTRNDHE